VRTSETVNELAAALAAAQGEMENAALNQQNPHFKSRYADLAAIRNATIPVLAKHGLSLLQTTDFNPTDFLLTTRLMHSSGQWVESIYPIPVSDRPHIMGSALTYARRYSWAALTGIAAEEDEDGNAAQDSAKNGTRANPFFPDTKRKSSAQAKRDGDWPTLEKALADTQSAREVERLREEWVRDWYPTWKDDWRDAANEEFDKRLALFSRGEDLKQTLKDSIEDDEHADFRKCRDWLSAATTATDLVTRAKEEKYRAMFSGLTEAQQDSLRTFYKTQLGNFGRAEVAQ
jgi:hypothetical protein